MKRDTIVVGYDGSDNARHAVIAAVEEVTDGGVIHVVTAAYPAADWETSGGRGALPEELKYVYDPNVAGNSCLAEVKHLVERSNVRCETHLVPDEPATAILDVAEREGADLIVVGSRGLGGIGRFLRGSVSARLATHAPVSLMIVHDPDTVAA